jgi:hypothetical protein
MAFFAGFRANAGRLSFGDFSLATQRKVTRPPGGTGYVNQIREANTNKTSRTTDDRAAGC